MQKVNFVIITQNDDLLQRNKEEPSRHNVFRTKRTMESRLCNLIIDGKIYDHMVYMPLEKNGVEDWTRSIAT